METKLKKITGKKYALCNSYFKNRKAGTPATVLDIVQYWKEHEELPFEYNGNDWLFQAMIEQQKRFGVHNEQFLTPDNIAKQLIELTNNFIPKNNLVLDACCGTGQLTKYLLENNFDVKGFDIDPEMVEVCTLMYPDASFQKYDFQDENCISDFDLIVSNPPYSAKELSNFFNWLSIALTDIGRAIILIPKDFIKKERPKQLVERLSRFNILHQEDMIGKFHFTQAKAEILVLELTKEYKLERGRSQFINESTENIDKKTANEININTNMTTIQDVNLNQIVLNPLNPRKKIREAYIEELAQSIKTTGLIQAITLREKNSKYEIVAGECRYRAFCLNQSETIPAIIGDYTDEEVMLMALAENINREDLNPLEEAGAYLYFIKKKGYVIEDLNIKFGKTPKYIKSRLLLLSLIADFKEIFEDEKLSISMAIELAKYSKDIQQDAYNNFFKPNDQTSWFNIGRKELAERMVKLYTTTLNDYEFDKTECKTCQYNTDTSVLFDECKGKCTNLKCLKEKQTTYMLNTCKKHKEFSDFEIIVSPTERINPEIENQFKEEGIEIKTAINYILPEKPIKPKRENYKLNCDYQEALEEFKIEDGAYCAEIDSFETKVEQGVFKRCLHVGGKEPLICYLHITKKDQKSEKELQEELNKSFEATKINMLKEAQNLLKTEEIPLRDFSMFEEEIFLYFMLGYLDSKYFPEFGIIDAEKKNLTDKEKETIISNISQKQYGILKRQFIIKAMLQSNPHNIKNTPTKLQMYVQTLVQQFFPEKFQTVTQKYLTTFENTKKRIEKELKNLKKQEEANV